MRRSDQEIEDRSRIDDIVRQAQVCRLGLCRDGEPYVVPVSFGYDGRFLYFHTAQKGKKIGFIAANPRACFELEHDVHVLPHPDNACEWGMSYYSVIGTGTVEEITDGQEKSRALEVIVAHYAGHEWALGEANVRATRVWRIRIKEIGGKQSRDKPR